MAHSTLHMIHPTSGKRKRAPVGFSWTSLFFGVITPIWRQDWLAAVVLLPLTIVSILFGVVWIQWILQGFFYNSWYLEQLIKNGYQLERAEGQHIDEIEASLGMRVPRYETTQPLMG
jgi:hypothetical protein